ncbi:hypothetical protein VTK26DRAFT_4929 [Humicola hyalothermophila]
MILPAPLATAPCTTLRPTQPAPNTAMLLPRSTLAVMRAAPYPVVMPQPSRQVRSMGASGCTATTEMSATTVYWLKVEVPMKWRMSWPRARKRLVPSGMTPRPWVARILPQRLVLPDLQNLHSRHSGVYSATTWSPGLTLVTPSPTDSTMPAPSCPRITGNAPSGSLPDSV